MATIGSVRLKKDGSFEGRVKMLSFAANIKIVPVKKKASADHPDYHVYADHGVELGAGWNRKGKESGKDYTSFSFSAPELGDRPIRCNLGRAPGGGEGEYNLIWNAQKK